MKKTLALFPALLALAIAGCEKEKPINEITDVPEGMQRIEITVSIEQPESSDSKATLATTQVAFAEGDQIAVIGTKNNVPEVITLSVSSYSAGSVTFSAVLSEDYTFGDYAYYPATIATTTETEPAINWPIAIDGSKVQVPMVALIDKSNNTAVFKHLGAVAKIALTNVPAGATKLKFTANTNITGPYTVSYSGAEPTATPGTLTGATITADINGNGTYYIPLPVGSYSDFQFAMINSSDTYYYKQKTATRTVTFERKHIVNFGTLNYDVDEIAEWWHVSPINGWNKGYDRYIKTGANTYQLTVFNPSSDEYWDLQDVSGNKWCVSGNPSAWSGTVTKTGDTFHRTGASNKTFWVTLSKDGSSWSYNSGNWDNNSDRGWSSSSDPVKLSTSLDIDGVNNDWDVITLTKYNYDANYGYKYEGLIIPDNAEYEFKFILNGTWCGSNSTISLSDATPYATGDWGGSKNMKFKLTAGTYNIYIDVATLNFMFVKLSPAEVENMSLSPEYNI